MWKEDRSELWKKILLALLILIVGAGFVFFYKYVKDQQKIVDAEQYALSQISSEQKKQETNLLYEQLQAQYDTDVETVRQYLPGIVCWGDTLTVGAASGDSFPLQLQEDIDLYINDKYDFRYTVEHPEDYPRAVWDDYKINIEVINMGGRNETSQAVLGRSGADPFVLRKDLEIPAECEPVRIEFLSSDGRYVYPDLSTADGFNPVRLYGVEGTISIDEKSYSKYSGNLYYFTRLQPGEPVTAPSGARIMSAASDKYKDYIQVICIGAYGGYKDAKDLVAQVKQQVARNTVNGDRFIILGIPSSALSLFGTEKDDIEAAMTMEFGSKFINLRKYLSTDAMNDAGLKLTDRDQAYMRAGDIPPSLQNPSDATELNAAAYKIIGDVVYKRMELLGYFKEVKDELGITDMEKAEKQAEISQGSALNK